MGNRSTFLPKETNVRRNWWLRKCQRWRIGKQSRLFTGAVSWQDEMRRWSARDSFGSRSRATCAGEEAGRTSHGIFEIAGIEKPARDTGGKAAGRVTDLGTSARSRRSSPRTFVARCFASRARPAGSILGTRGTRLDVRRATGRRMQDARAAAQREAHSEKKTLTALTTIFRTPPRVAVTS